MTPQEVLDQAIRPAAEVLGIANLPHLQLGFGTCGQETGFRNEAQAGGGPAVGLFQMEPGTYRALWKWATQHPKIEAALMHLAGTILIPSAQHMLNNPAFAAGMMFVKYLSCPGAIPVDLQGQAEYYKKWYNTPLGKATVQEYIDNFRHFSVGIAWEIKDDNA